MKAPTPEQLQAIQAFAAENGRNWKERLRDAWLRADARIAGEPSPLLQQVRNQFGPSWLDRYTLTGEPWPDDSRYLDEPVTPPARCGMLRVDPMPRKFPKRNC